MSRALRQRGGAPASPVLRAATELLEDGEPREFNSVVRELGRHVPPGVAIRKTEMVRRGQRKDAPDERVRQRDPERLIESGRRTIVRQALRAPFFEYSEHDGARFVRLVEVPPRVQRDREAERDGLLVDPARVIAAAEAGEDVTFLLHDATRAALLRVSLALAARLSDSQR